MSELSEHENKSVKFWAYAVWGAPVAALAIVCVCANLLLVFDGVPLAGVEFSPLQALFFSSGIFLPVSAYFYANSEWGFASTRMSRAWPSTLGIVESSEIVDRYFYRQGRAYRLAVTYRYGVSGDSYVGHRVSFGSRFVLDEEFIKGLAAKYRAGAKALVHYDPAAPSESVLEVSTESAAVYARGDRKRAGIAALIPLVCFLVVGLRATFH